MRAAQVAELTVAVEGEIGEREARQARQDARNYS